MSKIPLSVCLPNGKRIMAKVDYSYGFAHIKLPYIKLVEKDNPDFSKDGIIRIKTGQKAYRNIIAGVEKYLEDLFLKEMSNDHRSTSNERNIDRSGIKKPCADKSVGESKGSGRSTKSVCDSTRRTVETKDIAKDIRTDTDTDGAKLAKRNNPQDKK